MTPKYRFYNGERNNPYVLEQNIVRYLYWGMEAVESYMLQLHPDMPDSWLACYRKKMESGQVPEWISCRNEPEEEKAFVYYVYAKSLDRRDACCRIMSREPFWFATIES